PQNIFCRQTQAPLTGGRGGPTQAGLWLSFLVLFSFTGKKREHPPSGAADEKRAGGEAAGLGGIDGLHGEAGRAAQDVCEQAALGGIQQRESAGPEQGAEARGKAAVERRVGGMAAHAIAKG